MKNGISFLAADIKSFRNGVNVFIKPLWINLIDRDGSKGQYNHYGEKKAKLILPAVLGIARCFLINDTNRGIAK